MAAGGYEHRASGPMPKHDDWDWKEIRAAISHPAFWKRDGNQWMYRTMFKDIPLPLDWPVYVSQAEAKAYAKWAGKSLPTEAEWQRAAYATPMGEKRTYPWGAEAPSPAFGNFDFARWNPAPVNAFPEGRERVRGRKVCWAMVGSGLRPSLLRFPVSIHFLFTADTPPIFSMASISS